MNWRPARQTRHMRKAIAETKSMWAGRIPLAKPGHYADGLPFDQVRYLCCKLVLRPNHFRSRKSLLDFTKVLREPAAQNHVRFSTGRFDDAPIQIREVLFVDTPDFWLYNSGFILRRRIRYQDGFPVGDPEIVFKFRHPDLQTAATCSSRAPTSTRTTSSRWVP